MTAARGADTVAMETPPPRLGIQMALYTTRVGPLATPYFREHVILATRMGFDRLSQAQSNKKVRWNK